MRAAQLPRIVCLTSKLILVAAAGVWNGDYPPEIASEFTEDVTDCGCYWVGNAREMVSQCPGLHLGAFFEFPPGPSTPAPSPATPSPTPNTVRRLLFSYPF